MSWQVMVNAFPVLLQGALVTVEITAFAILLGFVLGVMVGLARLQRRGPVAWLALAYVQLIRGTPLLVLVFFIYFGLPVVLGRRIDPFAAAVVATSLNAGAYIGEIVRAGIESIHRGQWEASVSLGMTPWLTMRHVILPQAIRRMVPPLGNQFIITLKDTSLLSVIAVEELTRRGQLIIATNFRSFEVWGEVALLYVAMILLLSRLLGEVERRVEVH
ncbi:glutamine ABC transporter permease [Limnochorda pilosa]|uniref:Glutamine ABC transporter permease n=2 Tax=Limnochorda pilosa TaxID=1555112 RepID=A0A0K2SGY4_LIMPI|nr:amino acid ABC transporter permease [Limnochorda pilosa]BAS26376.1 glutamine ABC transporter permease [Limnochorda pilosa]